MSLQCLFLFNLSICHAPLIFQLPLNDASPTLQAPDLQTLHFGLVVPNPQPTHLPAPRIASKVGQFLAAHGAALVGQGFPRRVRELAVVSAVNRAQIPLGLDMRCHQASHLGREAKREEKRAAQGVVADAADALPRGGAAQILGSAASQRDEVPAGDELANVVEEGGDLGCLVHGGRCKGRLVCGLERVLQLGYRLANVRCVVGCLEDGEKIRRD